MIHNNAYNSEEDGDKYENEIARSEFGPVHLSLDPGVTQAFFNLLNYA